MGVIRKKTASRGTEAGTKFHCDVCSIDVTSTVSLNLVVLCSLEDLLSSSETNATPSHRFASRVRIRPAPNMTSVSPASQPERTPKTMTLPHIHSK